MLLRGAGICAHDSLFTAAGLSLAHVALFSARLFALVGALRSGDPGAIPSLVRPRGQAAGDRGTRRRLFLVLGAVAAHQAWRVLRVI